MPKRKSNRLHGYDYSQNGAYFVTICTKDKQNLLATFTNRRGGALLLPQERIELLPKGKVCVEQIRELENRYQISVEKYIIMPNHIHMIITIQREEQSPSPTISDIICTFKSITTKIMNTADKENSRKIWQRSFHDHIIRDEHDYEAIWQYIDSNPLKWTEDCFYTT